MADDNQSTHRPVNQDPAPDPLQVMVTGYIIGSLLHGGLDLSLITIDAAMNDNRSSFVVEGKHTRKRLHVTVREMRDS